MATEPNVSWGISNGLVPTREPRALGFSINYGAAPANSGSFVINPAIEEMMAQLQFVQSIFIDNSKNTAKLTLTISITNQVLIWPIGYMGYMPILAADSSMFTFATTPAAITVTAFLINVPIAPYLWSGA